MEEPMTFAETDFLWGCIGSWNPPPAKKTRGGSNNGFQRKMLHRTKLSDILKETAPLFCGKLLHKRVLKFMIILCEILWVSSLYFGDSTMSSQPSISVMSVEVNSLLRKVILPCFLHNFSFLRCSCITAFLLYSLLFVGFLLSSRKS